MSARRRVAGRAAHGHRSPSNHAAAPLLPLAGRCLSGRCWPVRARRVRTRCGGVAGVVIVTATDRGIRSSCYHGGLKATLAQGNAACRTTVTCDVRACAMIARTSTTRPCWRHARCGSKPRSCCPCGPVFTTHDRSGWSLPGEEPWLIPRLPVATAGRGAVSHPPDDTLGNGGLDDGDYTDDVRLRAPTRWPEREAIRVLPHGAQHTVRTADAAQAA